MLTPQGMRQRYLLGRYNWQRFGKMYYNGDIEANMKNLTFAQSTLVYRTMQSGEAELNGFLHEYVKLKGRPYLSRPQWDQFLQMNSTNSTWNVRGVPPFSVRRAYNLSESLQRFATVEGYTPKPIYTSQEPEHWEVPIETNSCPYADLTDKYRWPLDSSYTEALYLRDNMREAYQQVFNLN